MLERSEQIKTQCTGLDVVLDGGLKRGRILEISGPPGSPKEKLLIEIASVFAKAEGVLFVGN
jgi:RAD51-like protein 2